MAAPRLTGLLFRMPLDVGTAFSAREHRFDAGGVRFTIEMPRVAGAGLPAFAFAGTRDQGVWLRATADKEQPGEHAWEIVHEAALALHGAAGAPPEVVEPDLLQSWFPLGREEQWLGFDTGESPAGELFRDQNKKLPHKEGLFAWHLGDAYSGLTAARAAAKRHAPNEVVRIAHLDTGYDPEHEVFRGVRIELAQNFVDDDRPKDATDPYVRGVLKQPSHGTGTLGILAGGRIRLTAPGYQRFDAALGGAPDAAVVPIRVGNSVVQLKTSSVAQAIAYIVELCRTDASRIHVLSMSMGGVASIAWADAVNRAYDAGVVLVTAAGNNFSLGVLGGAPTRRIVYPARFRRVIAACGVMEDGRAYDGLPVRTMQGNWGPSSKMATAMAAYTPNTPWARHGGVDIVDMDGAGTSSATPQIAAAAALYIQRHGAALFDQRQYPHPWQRVEAVRSALFGGAERLAGQEAKTGHGALRASKAIAVAPKPAAQLRETGRDSATFAFLRVLTGLGMTSAGLDMLALEATQLAQRWPAAGSPNALETAIDDPDAAPATDQNVSRFLEALAEHPDASRALRTRARWALEEHFTRRGRSGTGGGSVSAAKPSPSFGGKRAGFTAPLPSHRPLRCFTLDPSLAVDYHTAPVSESMIRAPWEPVAPGPIGEYLEILDIDPASGCFYEPVNLDDPAILAQHGLPPSLGSPQFHQQMVYAVCSLTIRNFEFALGRRSLWSPGPPASGKSDKDDSHYVQRLRVYPHALRGQNAYYSPAKVALMFGYFNATPTSADDHLHGGRVFTCLSHDIIAHETSHALLDGVNRQFRMASNPDVHGFHEAFADIVALFQHFTFPDVLRHQIAATRGSIREQFSLLGSLATEFGRATGRRAGLRNGIGAFDEEGNWRPHTPDPEEYARADSPHARGAVLVGAIFDAFLRIYERRSADFVRLASGGTGVLRPGALHPDLVDRLASEAARSAQHVLTMCIRALDYCPPTDITFGEYLRAIISADYDLVRDDDLYYRVAFVEAFRRRGIYPRDVRALSVESLLWRGPKEETSPPSDQLAQIFTSLRPLAMKRTGQNDRARIFSTQRAMRRLLHRRLAAHISSHEKGREDAAFLGLETDRDRPRFEVRSARIAMRTGPSGDVSPRLFVTLLQRVRKPADEHAIEPLHGGPTLVFEGGSTIVTDLQSGEMLLCIRKRVNSLGRLARQQAYRAAAPDSLFGTYFGNGEFSLADEPFAFLHRNHA